MWEIRMDYIDIAELLTLLPYSRQNIARLEDLKSHPFPRRFRLGSGPRSKAWWRRDEVMRWLAEREARREQPPT